MFNPFKFTYYLRLLLIGLSLLLPGKGRSESSLQVAAAAVKVFSQNSEAKQNNRLWQGSGVLFQRGDGNVFVLSLAHNVIHDLSPSHEIFVLCDPTLCGIELKLKAKIHKISWAHDLLELAVDLDYLDVSLASRLRNIALKESYFKPRKVEAGTANPCRVLGFPMDLSDLENPASLTTIESCEIRNIASVQPFLPSVRSFVEVDLKTHVGSSGSLVTTSENNQFLGLLARQKRILKQSGKKPQIVVGNKSTESPADEFLEYVIPSEAIYSWILLEANDPSTQLNLNPSGQLLGVDQIELDGILLKESSGCILTKSGDNAVGGEGHGIGGEGHGIGGAKTLDFEQSADSRDFDETCKIKVTPAPNAQGKELVGPPFQWLQKKSWTQMRDWVKEIPGASATIQDFYLIKENKKYPINSLVGLLSLIENFEAVPLPFYTDESDAAISKTLASHVKAIETQLKKLRSQPETTTPGRRNIILRFELILERIRANDPGMTLELVSEVSREPFDFLKPILSEEGNLELATHLVRELRMIEKKLLP